MTMAKTVTKKTAQQRQPLQRRAQQDKKLLLVVINIFVLLLLIAHFKRLRCLMMKILMMISMTMAKTVTTKTSKTKTSTTNKNHNKDKKLLFVVVDIQVLVLLFAHFKRLRCPRLLDQKKNSSPDLCILSSEFIKYNCQWGKKLLNKPRLPGINIVNILVRKQFSMLLLWQISVIPLSHCWPVTVICYQEENKHRKKNQWTANFKSHCVFRCYTLVYILWIQDSD